MSHRYYMTDADIVIAVEELAMDGVIAFATNCRSTAKRTIRRMNEYLESEHCDWRAELTVDKELIWPYGAKIV